MVLARGNAIGTIVSAGGVFYADIGGNTTGKQYETQVNGSTVLDLGNGSTLTISGIAESALAAKNFV